MNQIVLPKKCPRCRSKHCGLNLRTKGMTKRTQVYRCGQCKHEWPVVFTVVQPGR
jgi:hypothetical protein